MATRLRDRTERLIKMEQLLFRSADGLRAVELAEACGVDRRTVYRDLSLLDEMGVPVSQKDGRFCLQRDQYLATLRLNFDETVALLFAASTARNDNPHLASALAKLSQTLPDAVAMHASALAALARGESERGSAEVLDKLTRAWSEQRCVKLWLARRGSDALHPHEISIYFLQPKPNGAVYVVGYDSAAGRVRAFRLSRIKRVEIMQTTYRLPFHLDAKRYWFYLRAIVKAKAARASD